MELEKDIAIEIILHFPMALKTYYFPQRGFWFYLALFLELKLLNKISGVPKKAPNHNIL